MAVLKSYFDFPITPAPSVLGGASQHREHLTVEEPAMTNVSNAQFSTFSPSGALHPGTSLLPREAQGWLQDCRA